MDHLWKITALILLLLTVSACHSSPASGGRTPPRADNNNGKSAITKSSPDTKAAPEKQRDPIPSAGNPDTQVWVNTNSGVYHCPGTPWYGNTKSGEYMTQKEAQARGYRPAHRSVCG